MFMKNVLLLNGKGNPQNKSKNNPNDIIDRRQELVNFTKKEQLRNLERRLNKK